MKIEKIKLYDLEIVELDGEFREIKKNEKTIPLLLTNYSLYKGEELGLIETSAMDELYNIYKVYEEGGDPSKIKTEADMEKYGGKILGKMSQVVDDKKLLGILYMGAIGANPNFEYDFEGFIKRCHLDLEEKLTIYVNLLQNLVTEDNNYKKEFEKLTSKKKVKGEKK